MATDKDMSWIILFVFIIDIHYVNGKQRTNLYYQLDMIWSKICKKRADGNQFIRFKQVRVSIIWFL